MRFPKKFPPGPRQPPQESEHRLEPSPGFQPLSFYELKSQMERDLRCLQPSLTVHPGDATDSFLTLFTQYLLSTEQRMQEMLGAATIVAIDPERDIADDYEPYDYEPYTDPYEEESPAEAMKETE